ncbi:Inosine-5-monophosphate dehydrogenase [Globisporangium polare]
MRVAQLLLLRGALLRASAAQQPRTLSVLTAAASSRGALLALRSGGSAAMVPTAREFRRQLVTATFARLDAAPAASSPTAAPVKAAAADASASSTASAASASPAEDVDNVKIDLSTIGAETTRVLTIADVLNTREQQVANGPSTSFEEWESIPGSQSVHDAIALMVKRNMRSLIVTEESAGIVGIITERDLLRKTSPRTILTQETLVRDIMSSHIMCVPPTTTVIDALATMTKENIRHLAVINGELSNTVKIGSVPEEAMRCVLSIKDIVKAYSEFEAEKKQALLEQLQSQVDAASADAGAVTADAPTPSTTTAPTDTAPTSAEPAAASTPSAAPAITAATLLKKKHKKIKLILNTREEDNISVADAVEAMARQNFGAVLLVDKDQRVLGIFTERDYLAKVVYYKEDPATIRMVDVSTRNVACLQIEDSLEKCWSQAASQDFRHFPVIGVMRKDREKELAGILSIKDIVREISKEHNTTPGFRLMEFFKSKMEPKAQEAPVAAPAAPATPSPVESSPAPVAEASVEQNASKQDKAPAASTEEPKSTKQ